MKKLLLSTTLISALFAGSIECATKTASPVKEGYRQMVGGYKKMLEPIVKPIEKAISKIMTPKRWAECTFAPKKNKCTEAEIKYVRISTVVGGLVVAAAGAAVAVGAHKAKKHLDQRSMSIDQARKKLADDLAALHHAIIKLNPVFTQLKNFILKYKDSDSSKDYYSEIPRIKELMQKHNELFQDARSFLKDDYEIAYNWGGSEFEFGWVEPTPAQWREIKLMHEQLNKMNLYENYGWYSANQPVIKAQPIVVLKEIIARSRYPKTSTPMFQSSTSSSSTSSSSSHSGQFEITPNMSFADFSLKIRGISPSISFIPKVVAYYKTLTPSQQKEIVNILDRNQLITYHAKKLRELGIPVTESRSYIFE